VAALPAQAQSSTCAEKRRPHRPGGLRSNPLELGWRLHPDFWHQGLASEAAARMTAFAFDDLSAAELLAVRHPDNVASGRVMDRLGMRFRGLEPWYGRSLATHSLTKAEWQSQQPLPGEATREIQADRTRPL
jgi:RimJ/RimL family protein N-acetyltransferase